MFTTLKVLKDFKRGLLPLIKTLKVIHKLSTGTLKTLQVVDILWISLAKSFQVGRAGATGGGWGGIYVNLAHF